MQGRPLAWLLRRRRATRTRKETQVANPPEPRPERYDRAVRTPPERR